MPSRTRRPYFLTFAALLAAISWSPVAAQSTFSRDQKPFEAISRMFIRNDARDSLVNVAKSQLGVSYRLGAIQPGRAFDCSGLVQWVLARFNIEMPRTSRDQARIGTEIPKDPDLLLPGDLLYFGNGRVVDHIGIYIGDGRYIHAANRRKGVIEAELPQGRLANTWWKGVRRVFTHEEEILESTAITPRSPVFAAFGL